MSHDAQKVRSFEHPGEGRKRAKSTPKGRQVDPQAAEEIALLLGDRPRRRDLLIEHLHLIQDAWKQISASHLAALADEMKLSFAEVFETAKESFISSAKAARWLAEICFQASWMRCRCSIKRSRRRGRSPSKRAISSAACGSTWRPLGVDLARFRPSPGCSNERTFCASWLIETSHFLMPA